MKSLIRLLLLIAGPCVIFFAGWTQILLPPATYGVLFSKTSGFDNTVLNPGVFSWHWERIIPTNVTMFMFKVQPQSVETEISGSLPSADAISSTLSTDATFRYQAKITINFSVLPMALPELVEMEGLLPENLDKWTRTKGEEISHTALKMLHERVQITPLTSTISHETKIQEQLSTQFPKIKLLSIHFTDVQSPDVELYEYTRLKYLALINSQFQTRQEAYGQLAEQEALNRMKQEASQHVLKLLEEYGEVLERHPILISFLELQSESDLQLLMKQLLPNPDLEIE